MGKPNALNFQTILVVFFVISSASAFLMTNKNIKRKLTGKLRMMKTLPQDVVKYSQVPKTGVFTANSIPKGLLKDHSTKNGTWGVIRVSKGKLRYIINDPTQAEYILDENNFGVIEPQVKHQVAVETDDIEFVVEFYRFPGTGPVDEKRD